MLTGRLRPLGTGVATRLVLPGPSLAWRGHKHVCDSSGISRVSGSQAKHMHSPIHSFILQILVNAWLLASWSVCLPLVEGNNKRE